MSKGFVPSIAGTPDATRQNISKALGDANLQDKGIGFGTASHGTLAGKLNAAWAHVKLTASSPQTVDVPHPLGQVASFCTLIELRTPDGVTPPHATAVPISRGRWTKTACRMEVRNVAGAGSLAGAVAVFLVGGE